MSAQPTTPKDWTPAFPGQRPPFQPGHELSIRHGAYALLKLRPRAAELADAIRQLVPGYVPAHEPAVQAAAMTGARLEKAMAALEDAGETELNALDGHARGWMRLWLSALDKLGLTPLAMSKLGLNLALGKGAALRTLEDYIAREHGEGDEAA
jgi:hypothetical protein